MKIAFCVVAFLLFWHRPGHAESGIASVYCDPVTSIGRMRCADFTIAHHTLAFGTKVLLFNRHNRRWAVATVTDRGMMCDSCPPAMRRRVRARIVDMSTGLARALGSDGLTRVVLTVLLRRGREL